MSIERKLAAILSADVAGYSRLMGEDEVGTIRTLNACREITDTLIQQHRGRIVGTAGDSILAEFASAVDAMQCAVQIQQSLKAKNADLSEQQRMEFRIGINVGDVVVEGEQIYGDGVNVAARLQGLADAGGVFISGTVYDQIENKLTLTYEYLGEQTVKNITKPVRVYRVVMDETTDLTVRGKSETRVETPRRGVSTSQQQKKRRVGTAHLSRTALVAVGLLIVGGIATLLYSSFQTIRTPQSTLRNQEALPLPDKPSIAVLPFVNMSDNPEQEYFSDGLTEDLTTDLSKISSLFVIARNSAFTYKGKAVKVEEVGRELGVRYVLEGSVRKVNDQVRITAQLVDASTGYHLWSERYDRDLKDIFALQDEIRQKIVTALKVNLTKEEQERLKRAPTGNLEAYDYYLRGVEYYWRLTKETNAQARQMFEKAIELDSQYAAAYALLGLTYNAEWTLFWSQNPQTLEQALALVQKANTLDDSLPVAHRVLGWVYVWKKQYELAVTEGERAIALDPNDADSYSSLAQTLNLSGKPETAIELVEKAMRLNPHAPAGYFNSLGWAYALTGRYKEAIGPLKRSLALNPNFLIPHLGLAGVYSELDQEGAAWAETAEVLRLDPNFSLEAFRQRVPQKDTVKIERLLAALRKAGLK